MNVVARISTKSGAQLGHINNAFSQSILSAGSWLAPHSLQGLGIIISRAAGFLKVRVAYTLVMSDMCHVTHFIVDFLDVCRTADRGLPVEDRRVFRGREPDFADDSMIVEYACRVRECQVFCNVGEDDLGRFPTGD